MHRDIKEILDTSFWLLGMISFVVGCGFLWGWPAALVAFGLIFTIWPLAKQFAR